MFQFLRIANSAGIALSAIFALVFAFAHPQDAFAQCFKNPGCKPPCKPYGGGTVWNASTTQQIPWGTNSRQGSTFLPNPCPSVAPPIASTHVYPSRSYGSSPTHFSYPYYPASSISSYSTPQRYAPPAWHQDLTAEELRAKTIWSGADREDKRMQSEIVEKQLRDGPESPDAIKLAWSRAQYFLKAQKPTLAEPLLKELIVTLESHASTRENRKILVEARTKLYRLQAIKKNIEKPLYRTGGPAPTFPRGF